MLAIEHMNNDFSAIDANLSRAKEGMRVVEDIARFVLRDQNLLPEIRQLRHRLAQIEFLFGGATRLTGRSLKNDIGSESSPNKISERNNLWGLMKSNFSRTQEAIRVLEEFGKIYIPKHYLYLQEARHNLYAIEFKMVSATPHYWLHYYFEKGIVYPLSDNVEEIIFLIDRGAKIVQLRNKNNNQNEIFQQAKQLCNYIEKKESENPDFGKVILIIDDFVEVAALLPVAGIHLGQQDVPMDKARHLLGSNKIIGRSNQTIEQMKVSIKEGADYVSIGPVFATPIKSDREPVGLEIIKQINQEIFIPWVAIGGINKENAPSLSEAGAKNIAVIRSAREFFI